MSISNGQKNIFVLLLVWHKPLSLDELCNSCQHTTCFICHRQTLVRRSFAFPWGQNGTAGLPLVSNLQLQPPQSNPAHALFPIPKCFPHSMDWECSLSFLQNALVLLQWHWTTGQPLETCCYRVHRPPCTRLVHREPHTGLIKENTFVAISTTWICLFELL